MAPMENKDGQIESSTSSMPPVIPSPSLPEEFIFWKNRIQEISDDYQHFKEQVEQLAAISDERQKLAEEANIKQVYLSNRIKQIERNLSRQTKNNIELLGIFVTLFTFISVSASVALQIKGVYHASLFISVFCLCLFAFLHVFHDFIQASDPQRGFKKLCGICVLVFLVAVIMGGFCWQTEQKKASTETHATASLKVENSSTPQLNVVASTKMK